MTPKEAVTVRLQTIEVVEGVLPTPVIQSEDLHRAALHLQWNEVSAATRNADDHLKQRLPNLNVKSAGELLSGSEPLRDQAAGFAEAGIAFFYASQQLWEASLPERNARGANGIVSRVLLSEQRILLETPRIIIRFNEGIRPEERASILKRHQVEQVGPEGLPPDTIKGSTTRGDAIALSLALMGEPEVAYAEPDFIEHVGHRYTPTDPDFRNQWHHGIIKAERAWDFTKGEEISVAVIDNGFDIHHGELSFGPLSGWFRSTPDLADADFVPGTQGMRDSPHGTACAGMTAARANNALGGCGVAFSAALSMIACLSDQVGPQSTLARAVAYAADPSLENMAPSSGVDIITCSLGPNGATWQIRQVLSDALDFAATRGRAGKGCAIFWACTNGNFPIASDGVCSHQHVIAVGRSRSNDQDDGSGFGSKLEFLAPGVDVLIPTSGGGHKTTTGTSFAAPCAAGVAALALSMHPNATAAQVRRLLRDTCDKIGSLPYIPPIRGRNARFGYGRVNAELAVQEAIRLAALV